MKQKALVLKILIYVLGCLLCSNTYAQTRGTVEVIKDPRMDTLIAKRFIGFGKTPRSGSGYSSSYGYRIQIFTGSNRAEAFKAQSRLQQNFENIPTYISYREPNFKVKAGDFRTRLDAAKVMQSLKPYFPLMFIVQEKINPPKLEPEIK